jgi:POT family proton-dependent oligopeptide transporter
MSQNTTEFFKNLFTRIVRHCLNEVFSYYGMRALLVLFFTSSLAKGAGMGIEDAMALWNLYYVGLFHSCNGGLADRYLGYRWAVVLGALQ